MEILYDKDEKKQQVEQTGDHAEDIAKIVVMPGDAPLFKPLIDITYATERVEEMLHWSLEAPINPDANAARQIATADDEIENLHDQAFRELLAFMAKDPIVITRATPLIGVADSIERRGWECWNISH